MQTGLKYSCIKFQFEDIYYIVVFPPSILYSCFFLFIFLLTCLMSEIEILNASPCISMICRPL